MSLLGRNQSDVWKLNKAMYGYPRGANLWYQKLFKYLKEYGFRPQALEVYNLCVPRAKGQGERHLTPALHQLLRRPLEALPLRDVEFPSVVWYRLQCHTKSQT